MTLKPPRTFFYIALAFLAAILIAFYAIRLKIGQFAPDVIDRNFFNGVILIALGISLWNRKIWSDEKRAAAEAAEKAAQKRLDGGAAESPKDGDGD